MPSRPVMLCIILFWLGTLGWWVQRDIWPWLQAGDPPPLQFDLEDEVGGRVILWEIQMGGEIVGTAQTKISAKRGRSFEIENDMAFSKPTHKDVIVKKSMEAYRVDANGNLQSMKAELKVEIGAASLELKIKGRMMDGFLHLTMTPSLHGQQMPLPQALNLPLNLKPEPLDLQGKGDLVTVLHPQNKIPGLYEGRTWNVSMLDVKTALTGKIGLENLLAVVAVDNLEWPGGAVSCWRVDVFAKGKERPIGKVWVRRSDNLVLQHEANDDGVQLVMKRIFGKL